MSAGFSESHNRSTRARARPSSASLSITIRVASITRFPHQSCHILHGCRRIGLRGLRHGTGRPLPIVVDTDIQKQVRHPALRWMAATLDGRVQGSDAVYEAKFMLPWSFSEEAAAEKYMPQLQHNMWVVAARSAVLSVITGGGKWVEIATHADPLYQHLIVTAERKV